MRRSRKPVCPIRQEHVEAMTRVLYGGDIYDLKTATLLREVKRVRPKFIDIGEPMGAPADGAKRQPYFGAMLTGKGQLFLQDWKGENREGA